MTLELRLESTADPAVAVQAVKEYARAHGLTVTGAGLATVSMRASEEDAKSLFGIDTQRVAKKSINPLDFGHPESVEPAEGTVPGELREFVGSISVSGSAIRIGRSTHEQF